MSISSILAQARILSFSRMVSCTRLTAIRLYASEDDGGDQNAKTSAKETESPSSPTKAESKAKLHNLLMSIKDQKMHKQPSKPVELNAKPIKRNLVNETEPKTKVNKKGSSSSSSSSSDEEVAVDVDLIDAALRVAEEKAEQAKGDDDAKHRVRVATESDLLKKLRTVSQISDQSRVASEVSGATNDLASLVSTMNVEKMEKKQLPTKRVREQRDDQSVLSQEQIEFLEKRRRMRREARVKEVSESYKPTDLFAAEPPLGIFMAPLEETSANSLATWKSIQERELRIMSTPTPRNMLDDMARMTDNNILWHFPINNEQGIDQDQVRLQSIQGGRVASKI
jgi:small subunit ribosomal protein S31